LLNSLEGGNRRTHSIFPDYDAGETKKEAIERYVKETGPIGANDIVFMIVYDEKFNDPALSD